MSGKSPFFGLETVQVMVQVLQYQQPRSEDYPEIPSSYPLWSLIRSCWEQIPLARPRMQEVIGKVRPDEIYNSDLYTKFETCLDQLREHIHDEGPTISFFRLEEPMELKGKLEIPEAPELFSTNSDVYHGIWNSPSGEQVEVAIKVLRSLDLKRRGIDTLALKMRTDRVRTYIYPYMTSHVKRITPPDPQRLKREAWVWGHVKHPNLHTILGYRSEPRPMLISPWYRHGDISDYLKKNPDLSRMDKLKLVRSRFITKARARYHFAHFASVDLSSSSWA